MQRNPEIKMDATADFGKKSNFLANQKKKADLKNKINE